MDEMQSNDFWDKNMYIVHIQLIIWPDYSIAVFSLVKFAELGSRSTIFIIYLEYLCFIFSSRTETAESSRPRGFLTSSPGGFEGYSKINKYKF